MAEKKTNKIDTKKIVSICIAALAFIFIFISWFKISIMGYSEGFNILHSDMFDVSALMGIAKILAIVCIILFVAYVSNFFVDLKKLIPGLEKIDLDKYLPLGYYGLYAAALIFTLIGTFTCESSKYVHPAFGWYFALIIVACGLIIIFKPDFFEKVVAKIKAAKK